MCAIDYVRTNGGRKGAVCHYTGHVEDAEERLVRDGGVVQLERVRRVGDTLHGGHDGRDHRAERNYPTRSTCMDAMIVYWMYSLFPIPSKALSVKVLYWCQLAKSRARARYPSRRSFANVALWMDCTFM